jgi:peptidoglycan/xylan/chitin deacetylase (PgdA/CDA1 family)
MKRLSTLEATLLRGLGGFVAPRASQAALLVLIYHRVNAQHDPLNDDEPDAATFAAQMDLLQSLFKVLPLGEAVERLRANSLPQRAICVTFDDGYANNCDVALPILAARSMPATVFVSSGYLDGGRMWNDTVTEAIRLAPAEIDLTSIGLGRYALPDIAARRTAVDSVLGELKYLPPVERGRAAERVAEIVGRALPDDLMLREEQVRRLAAGGVTIGAHSVSHPILSRVEPAAARREIQESKAQLEAIVRQPVRCFAYPNGKPQRDYERIHVEMVREAGFDVAVSTAWGSARRHSDTLQLPRVAPWDRTALRFGARLMRSYADTTAEQV